MRTNFIRSIALLVGIGLCSPGTVLAQEKAEPKPTPFQETAQIIHGGNGIQVMEYGHFTHYMSWSRMKGGDIDEKLQKRFKSFPDELLKAIGEQDGADHAMAVVFLAGYLSSARSHAAMYSDKDLSLSARRALSPHTATLQDGLLASLDSKISVIRLSANLSLLFLDETHAKANEVFKASAATSEPEILASACEFIGMGCLASPQAIEFLGQMLKHDNKVVHQAAASAIITIGPPAKALVPALITYLETGKDVEGAYSAPYTFGRHTSGNLALMALASLKEHSKPAVPTIIARFPKANEADQVAMLVCLASAGAKDADAVALVRNNMQDDKSEWKLAAACTLLHLAPDDPVATEMMKKALANDKTKDLAIGFCQEHGPPSREIAAMLVPMLESMDEKSRINAMHALAAIGPAAEAAVPGLERLLSKELDHMTHTFLSQGAAAHALGQIRGKTASAALLRVFATPNGEAGRYAMIQLAWLGDDLPPNTLEVLLQAVKNKNGFAAFAICNLGERARPIRAELERLLDDEAVGWIIDTALRRMGEDGK